MDTHCPQSAAWAPADLLRLCAACQELLFGGGLAARLQHQGEGLGSAKH